MRSKGARLALVLLLALGVAGLWVYRIEAQVLYGSVVGTVTDPTGAVVPKATVTITNVGTNLVRETTTDEAGRYTFNNVLPGTYNVKVAATGFRPYAATGLAVTVNNILRLDMALQVGPVAEQVTVEAAAVALQTEKSDVRAEITTTALTNVPLPQYRNFQSLLVTVPGATPTALQNDITDSPSRSLRTNVNGTAVNTNNTRVDGAANVFVWLPHHTLYNPPIDAIETVNISTTSFDAEQGMTGGAAVTVVTKSGTNDIHGTATWYHDNQHLRARDYFWYRPKPVSINNIAGGTIGGPIVKNKVFYFFSYERTMERIGVTGRYNVPTEDIKRGDFSRFLPTWVVWDPLTGNADGSGRTPFEGNKVPEARWNSIFKEIQKMAPPPNGPGEGAFNLSNNYDFAGMRRMDRDQYDLKANWNVTQNLLVWGKYSRMDALVSGAFPFGELTGPGLGTGGTGDTNVNIPTFGYNYTISPTFLTDGVFGYTRFDQTVLGPGADKNWGLDVWKIPGTNGGKQYASDSRYAGQPALYTGFTVWGYEPTWFPLFRNDRSYTYTTNFSKVKGAHELRWGFDMIRHDLTHWQPETAHPRGAITFDSQATTLKGQTARIINQYAAALLGLVDSYGKSVQFFDMKTREWQFGGYFRDRWQVTPKLTLNLGLRYEYYPLLNRGDRGLERWDPATNIVYLGGVGNTPMNAGIEVSKKLFAPRIGFAYRLNNKTVIRSGYGITYDPLPFGRPLRGLYPATITANFNSEQYRWFNTLSEGIPDVPLPDISSGQVLLPKNVDMGIRSPWGGLLHRGYIQSWNFSIERELPGQIFGSVAYVGNHTVHQLLDRDINASLTPGSGNAGRPLAATQGRTITAYMWDGWADANYNGLQTSLKRNYRGLYLTASYTWSKSINYADEDGWQAVTFNHPQQLRRNRAPAGYDRTHMFVTSWVYDLPFGKGQRFDITNPVANAVFGGWRVNGMLSMYTGIPFNVTAGSSSLNMPGTTQTADIVAKPSKIGATGAGTTFYDVSAFVDPNWGRPADFYRLGSSGRNTLRGPGFIRPDLGFFKNFKLNERINMEFRAEAYNFTNTPRFNNPGANVSDMIRNAATGAITNTNNFMAIRGVYDGGSSGTGTLRQWRFGLRFAF